MYHQVADLPWSHDPVGLAVSPDQFEKQMRFLALHGYHCLRLSDAVQSLKAGVNLPEKTFVLTFDDGTRDFYSTAHPILSRYGFTATIFMVAGRVGLRSNWWGQDGDKSAQLLSWAEAIELVKHGHILGSHTLSHPFLTKLDSQSLLSEIVGSKKLLGDYLGIQIDHFSYPFSMTNPPIEKIVEAAGYSDACAGDSGKCGIYHLWRVPIKRNDNMTTFIFKVNGWYNRRTQIRESTFGLYSRQVIRRIKLKIRTRNLAGGHGIQRDTGIE